MQMAFYNNLFYECKFDTANKDSLEKKKGNEDGETGEGCSTGKTTSNIEHSNEVRV